MAHGVNAAVKAEKPAAPNPVRKPSVAEAKLDQLRTCNDPPLTLRKLRQRGSVAFPCHLARESAIPKRFAPLPLL